MDHLDGEDLSALLDRPRATELLDAEPPRTPAIAATSFLLGLAWRPRMPTVKAALKKRANLRAGAPQRWPLPRTRWR